MFIRRPYAVLLCLVVSCSDPTRPPGSPEEPDGGAEQAERQRRMNIKVEELEPELDEEGAEQIAQIVERTPSDFGEDVARHCRSLVVPFGVVEIGESGLQPDATTMCADFATNAGELGICTLAYCMVEWKLCEAHRLMEIADAPGYTRIDRFQTATSSQNSQDLTGREPGDAQVLPLRERVGPQLTESKARLAEMAFDAAGDAAAIAADLIRGVAGLQAPYLSAVQSEAGPDNPFIKACIDDGGVDTTFHTTVSELAAARGGVWAGPQVDDDRGVDEALAMLMVEATYVAEEAATRSAGHYSSVADAEYSRATDVSDSARLAWTDGELSRAHGAHLLVGGDRDSGLHGLWDEGFCPMPEPSAQVEAAIAMLRKSEADPAELHDLSIDVRKLVEGGNGPRSDEAIRSRLAERLSRPDLLGMDARTLTAEFGTNVDALSAARSYLRHEARAFGRDLSAVAPPAVIGRDPDTSALLLASAPSFVATGSAPTVPPRSYYSALTRWSKKWILQYIDDERVRQYCSFDGQCHLGGTCNLATNLCDLDEVPLHPRWHRPMVDIAQGVPAQPDPTLTDRSLIHLIDYVGSAAHDLVPLPAGRGIGQLRDPVLDVLATFASAMRSKRPGRLETCRGMVTEGGVVDRHRFRAYGPGRLEDYRVMKGPAGLRCAVTGNVEGAPCSLAEWSIPLTETKQLDLAEYDVGFSEGVEFVANVPQSDEEVEWLFVVKRRSGAPDLPGAYEPYGSERRWPVDIDSAPAIQTGVYDHCTLHPVVPEHEARAADMVTPSVDNCSRPKTSCTGFDFADRIPLENELTEDGDGVENSWRRYLDLALQSAEHADRLGEELIEFGFQIDNRIEVAQEELEDICGCPINLRDAAWGGVGSARGADCVQDDPQACADQPGFTCVNGRCIADLDDTATLVDARAGAGAQCLASCLGDNSVHEFAVLGDKDACLWRNAGDGAQDDSGSGGICDALPDLEGQTCPYVVGEGESCQGPESRRIGLPSGYEFVKVTEKLGIFHTLDPNARPKTPYTLDCGDVRQLRREALQGSPQKESSEAFARVRSSHGFLYSTVSNYASRVGWRAYPDDYSAITFDGQTKWTTGYPLIDRGGTPNDALEQPRWPCYGPHNWADDNPVLVDGKREMDRGGRMRPDRALFETYTSGCDDSDGAGRDDRVEMNHRMARAVLALKIAAGVPLDGFEAPYQPVARNFAWLESPDNNTCTDGRGARCDYVGTYWWAPEGLSPDTLWGGRLISTGGPKITFNVYETEGDNTRTDQTMDGTVYCWPGNRGGTLWTHLFDSASGTTLQNIGHGSQFLFNETCAMSGVRAEFDTPAPGPEFTQMPLVVQKYGSMNPDANAAAALWRGLDEGQDTQSLVGTSRERLDGLIRDSVLWGVGSPDDLLIRPSDDLTDYCRDWRNVIGVC